MSAAMAVRSSEILRAYDLDPAYLHRWREAGLIAMETPAASRALGATWPDWTWRMVALIRRCGYDGRATMHTGRLTPMAVLRGCAEVLTLAPDVPWVVFTEAGFSLPCYEASEVAAIHRHQTCTTVVAIPTLEEARTP